MRPDASLVMLSVGEEDGVRKGDRFEVRRAGERIGEVRVEEVFADMCSATILQPTRKRIEEGDDASRVVPEPARPGADKEVF